MITFKMIENLKPCYCPSKYIGEDWTGTVQEILRDKRVPPQDRIWVARNFIDDDTLFKFSENCCWQIAGILPDNEQLEYSNILCILRLARESNDEELVGAAGYAARCAAWGAAWGAAGYAALGAAGYAAWGAAGYAAGYATGYAARCAAWDEFCLMLADVLDGTFEDFYLLSRLEEDKG